MLFYEKDEYKLLSSGAQISRKAENKPKTVDKCTLCLTLPYNG